LLRYDPDTGKLFWRERSADLFTSKDRRGAAWACAAWNAKNAGREAFTADNHQYRVGAIFGQMQSAHRVAWAITHGVWPDCIDHQNGDASDNRLFNLRDAGRSGNQKNLKLFATNSSGVPGVVWDAARRRWRAEIGDRGRTKYLGRFTSKSAAIDARRKAECELGYHPNHGRAA
jgi:hypothetical protein